MSPGSHGLRRKDSCHNNLVDRILDALQKPESVGVVAGETDNSSDRVESDEDMTLVQYQKEAKAEAVAKRGAVRAALEAKKGEIAHINTCVQLLCCRVSLFCLSC